MDAPYRLPRTVVPRSYELEITPDLPSATFEGRETVAVDVLEPTAKVVLNAIELVIDEARVITGGATIPGRVSYDESEERAIIDLDRVVPVGEALIELRFSGILNDKLRGFYRSSYTDAGRRRARHRDHAVRGDRRPPRLPLLGRAGPARPSSPSRSSSTAGLRRFQRRSHRARPSRGRQGRRAVRRHDQDVHVPRRLRRRHASRRPRRSMVGGTPLRSGVSARQATPDRLRARHRRRLAAVLLDVLRHPVPGDKLDLIAIPDFAAGAMENLGAITFRETALLVDPAAASRRRAASASPTWSPTRSPTCGSAIS